MPPALPEPPEEPQVLSQSSHSVTLSWHKPLGDGGGDILGYKVERKIPGVGWQCCSQGLIQDTELTVDGLAPGEPYRFRVSAVNRAGASEAVHFPQMVQLGEDGHSPRHGCKPLQTLHFAWHACFNHSRHLPVQHLLVLGCQHNRGGRAWDKKAILGCCRQNLLRF